MRRLTALLLIPTSILIRLGAAYAGINKPDPADAWMCLGCSGVVLVAFLHRGKRVYQALVGN